MFRSRKLQSAFSSFCASFVARNIESALGLGHHHGFISSHTTRSSSSGVFSPSCHPVSDVMSQVVVAADLLLGSKSIDWSKLADPCPELLWSYYSPGCSSAHQTIGTLSSSAFLVFSCPGLRVPCWWRCITNSRSRHRLLGESYSARIIYCSIECGHPGTWHIPIRDQSSSCLYQFFSLFAPRLGHLECRSGPGLSLDQL